MESESRREWTWTTSVRMVVNSTGMRWVGVWRTVEGFGSYEVGVIGVDTLKWRAFGCVAVIVSSAIISRYD